MRTPAVHTYVVVELLEQGCYAPVTLEYVHVPGSTVTLYRLKTLPALREPWHAATGQRYVCSWDGRSKTNELTKFQTTTNHHRPWFGPSAKAARQRVMMKPSQEEWVVGWCCFLLATACLLHCNNERTQTKLIAGEHENMCQKMRSVLWL